MVVNGRIGCTELSILNFNVLTHPTVVTPFARTVIVTVHSN